MSLEPVVFTTRDPLIVTLGSSAPVEIKSSAKESSAKEVILIFWLITALAVKSSLSFSIIEATSVSRSATSASIPVKSVVSKAATAALTVETSVKIAVKSESVSAVLARLSSLVLRALTLV
jgi:hypothetical protein